MTDEVLERTFSSSLQPTKVPGQVDRGSENKLKIVSEPEVMMVLKVKSPSNGAVHVKDTSGPSVTNWQLVGGVKSSSSPKNEATATALSSSLPRSLP